MCVLLMMVSGVDNEYFKDDVISVLNYQRQNLLWRCLFAIDRQLLERKISFVV